MPNNTDISVTFELKMNHCIKIIFTGTLSLV